MNVDQNDVVRYISREESCTTNNANTYVLIPTVYDPPNVSFAPANPGMLRTVGKTEHVIADYEVALGNRGRMLASNVLNRVERDLGVICELFNMPIIERLRLVLCRSSESVRAWHYGDGELFVDISTTPRVESTYSSFLTAALITETAFLRSDLATKRGAIVWDPNKAAGEALSRVIASALYPKGSRGFVTASAWLDSERADFLHFVNASDRDTNAIGCCTLFLGYLHYQLGYSWAQIVAAGATNLAETYTLLSGDSGDAFQRLRSVVDQHFEPGRAVSLNVDNPFPLDESAQFYALRRRWLRPATVALRVAPLRRKSATGGGPGPAPAPARQCRPGQSVEAQTIEVAQSNSELRNNGMRVVAAGPSTVLSPQVALDLNCVIACRRWLFLDFPFRHVRAYDVFTTEHYEKMVAQMNEIMKTPEFGRNISGYDVKAAAITFRHRGALSVFASRAWNDMIAAMFGVNATGDVNVSLHHHPLGSNSGSPHNDLNPGWFLDEKTEDGIRVHDPALVDYRKGGVREAAGPGAKSIERVRAVGIVYYLGNPLWHPGDGGETGIYRSVTDPVDRPVVAIPPINNSLLAFECTPFSFHGFISNRVSERNSIVMWLHRPKQEVVARWGGHAIVYW